MKRLIRDRSGASSAEYALILAIIGAGIAVAAMALGNTIGNSINRASGTVANCGGQC